METSDRTLRSILINKEVVLLRQVVRKARVCVVSKLTREAKKLRSKRGDEKQSEKNKRKADKLGREVTVLKRAKDDEISRFGISNLEKLQEISQNPNAPDLSRVMAKVANQKALLPKLQEFKEKFPDYEEFMTSKKKKAKAKEKKPVKEAGETTKKSKVTKEVPTTEPVEQNDEPGDSVVDVNETNSADEEENNSDVGCESLVEEINQTSDEEAPASSISSKEKKPKVSKKEIASKKPRKNPTPEKLPPQPVKVISKVATVKRLTEMLEEENEDSVATNSEETPAEKENVEVLKEVDDFFMSADNHSAHYVIAATPREENNDTELEERSAGRYFNNHPPRNPKEKPFNNSRNWESGHPRKEKFNNRNWESAPPRKEKWNNAERMPQNKQQRDWQQQEPRRRNMEPERKKPRRNEEVTPVEQPEHLHPSWEAKRKQQEILKQGFQGKKIVFGDD